MGTYILRIVDEMGSSLALAAQFSWSPQRNGEAHSQLEAHLILTTA